MRRRLLLPAAMLAACLSAHAQIVSIYGTFSPTHVSNIATGSAQSSSGTTYYTTGATTANFGGGITLNFVSLGPVKLGFDLRGSTKSGTVGTDTALLGLKAAFKAPLIPFKPYVQASGGYLATRTANQSPGISGTFENRYAAYELLGGVDYHFLPFIDLRLVEIGGGQGFDTGITFNTQAKSVTLFTLNTGVVLHF